MNVQKAVNRYKIIGILGLMIAVVLIIHFSDIVSFLTNLAEEYISRDKQIGQRSIIILNIVTIACILFIIILSYVSIFNLTRKVSKFIAAFFQINHPLTSNICDKKHLDSYIMIIGTLLGVFQIFYLLIFGEPVDKLAAPLTIAEGKLEIFYNLLLIIALVILLLSITQLKWHLYSSILKKKIILSIIGICGLLVLIIGEELSWGQQFFRWESTGIFVEYNYQNETNVHNFFNPIFVKYIYPIVGLSSFMVLFLVWLFPNMRKSYYFNLFFPHPSLFFLVFLMAFSSFLGGGGETFEQIFTIFTLLYGFRIFMSLRYPNRNILLNERKI